MVDAGLAYTNNHLTARRTAGYLADQMEVGNWVLDIGGRFEGLTGDVKRELNSTVTTDTTPNLSPRLAQVAWGNGQYLGGTVKPSAWAVAGGALYRLDDRHSLFVNASRGFFMPQLNTVQIDTHNDVQSFEAEIIKQSEAGFKFSGTRLSATIAAFYSTLLNRRNINLINGPTPGSAPSEVVNLISTRSYGAEGTFNIRLTNILSFESNATYEHDYYTEYTPVAACQACVGNFLQRQPNVLANAGLYFRHRGFDGAFYDSYTGRTFTSDLNNIELPSYHIFRLDLGYSYAFTRGDRVRLGLSVYNLFDNQAVSEGSPRQGTLQNVGQAYFIGRQVLPRRISARLSYDF
jgi:outer membrane receptor protein involved in Fe transport